MAREIYKGRGQSGGGGGGDTAQLEKEVESLKKELTTATKTIDEMTAAIERGLTL